MSVIDRGRVVRMSTINVEQRVFIPSINKSLNFRYTEGRNTNDQLIVH